MGSAKRRHCRSREFSGRLTSRSFVRAMRRPVPAVTVNIETLSNSAKWFAAISLRSTAYHPLFGEKVRRVKAFALAASATVKVARSLRIVPAGVATVRSLPRADCGLAAQTMGRAKT